MQDLIKKNHPLNNIKLPKMKKQKITMLLAAMLIAGASFAQKGGSDLQAEKKPAHFPAQRTDANVQSWAKQYPREAADYNEAQMQKMMKLDLKVPQQQQQYVEMKKEYKMIQAVTSGNAQSAGTKR